MAGHSKWANIRYRKSRQDSKRGAHFTRLLRDIRSASKQGGEEPSRNPKLRTAIEKALAYNMTREVIDRALKNSTKREGALSMLYEGYGPEGVALLVECVTDNKNRTAGELRYAFSKNAGRLAKPGEVSYLFVQQGLIWLAAETPEAVLEIACSAGAEEIEEEEGQWVVSTTPAELSPLLLALQPHVESSELAWVPKIAVTLQEQAPLMTLVEQLEALEDVEAVHHNALLT